MPRAKIETAYLGWQTVRILAGVPDAQAAWLIKAICVWILEGREPEDIPPECIGSWIAIHDESVRIHESMKESALARANHARNAAAARWNAQACPSMPEHAQACPTDAQACPAMRESKKESNNSASPTGDASIARTPAPVHVCEDDPGCPMDEARLKVVAEHIGMPENEVAAWRDYYTMRGWRADPRSPRPMTAAQTEASLRRWHTNEGVRAAKQAHLDAKMDERHQQTLAARAGAAVSAADAEAEERRRKEREAADLERAKILMNW